MPELSLYNIEQISGDIRMQEITFSHLLDDLIDHVCCDVEQEMRKGLDFSEAYRRVKQKMGSRRLKEIQEETLYAVDTKYRQMKNTMKISGIAGTVMFGFASLFKIMHWPGAGILFVAGAFTLAVIFMPSALVVLWKETRSPKRLFLFIMAFLAAFFFITGSLFKVQHWPGAGLLMILAAISSVIFFIPSLLVSTLKDPESKSKKPVYITGAIGLMIYVAGFLFKMQHWPLAALLIMLGLSILFLVAFPWYVITRWSKEDFIRPEFIYMVVGSLAIVIPAALTIMSAQRNYDRGYFTHLDQEKALSGYLYEKNDNFIAGFKDSANYETLQQIHSKTNELIAVVNSIESEMVGLSEGTPDNPVENPKQISILRTGQAIDYVKLSNPFHPLPVKEFLMPGTEVRTKLEKAISDYKNYLSGIVPEGFTSGINLQAILPSVIEDGRDISMMTGLHSLALLRNSVCTSENAALKQVALSR